MNLGGKRLKEYLTKRGMTQGAFASIIETDEGNLSRIINGPQLPSLPMAARIKVATNGYVESDDFIKPDCEDGAA